MIGHRISAIRPNVKGPFQFWIGLEGSPSTLACHSTFHRGGVLPDAATACRVRIRRPGELRGFINPQSIIRFLLLSPPSVLALLSSSTNEKNSYFYPLYTHKMAPYAPAQVQLLPSWDNGPYSPVLDVDDRYPTLEPSEDQYNGPYLPNALPSANSLIRSPSHRHSWSCHPSDEHRRCCDSGAVADSPQYRQISYAEGDYVYSSDGYLPSQHTPNDQVSPPTSAFRPVRLMFEVISLPLVLLPR